MSPPNVTAFTPYRYSAMSHPLPNTTFLAFQGSSGSIMSFPIDYQVSPSPQFFQYTPPVSSHTPALHQLSTPSPLTFNYQSNFQPVGYSGSYQSPRGYVSLPKPNLPQMQPAAPKEEVSLRPLNTKVRSPQSSASSSVHNMSSAAMAQVGKMNRKKPCVPALNLGSIEN